MHRNYYISILLFLILCMASLHFVVIQHKDSTRDILRLNAIRWERVVFWYTIEKAGKSVLCYSTIDDSINVKELQTSFHIDHYNWLPTKVDSMSNRLELTLSNGESFVMIFSNHYDKDDGIISIGCYNRMQDIESYDVHVNAVFLKKLRECIKKSPNTVLFSE